MTKIYLHGNLKDKFGDEFDLDVSSSSEALTALAAMKPGFLSEVMNNRYGVILGDKENGIPVSTMEDFKVITHRDIHIVPVMEGADPGTIAAITLALDSFFAVILPANMAIAATNAVMYLAPQIGTSLLIAGVSALLSPQEESSEQEDTVFNNAIGTARQGGCIPLPYGEFYADLVPISTSISNELVPDGDFFGK